MLGRRGLGREDPCLRGVHPGAACPTAILSLEAALRFLLTLLLTLCVQAQYDFIPQELPARIERVLMGLHYGWCRSVPLPPSPPLYTSPRLSSRLLFSCSLAMDLITGDLTLIKAEKARPKVPILPPLHPLCVHPTPVSHPHLPRPPPTLTSAWSLSSR